MSNENTNVDVNNDTNVSGVATVFNTPNFAGEVYLATPSETPLLSLIGGVSGENALKTASNSFSTGSLFQHPDAEQPAISEDDAVGGKSPYTYVGSEVLNVTQTFQEIISISYAKMANSNRLTGITDEEGSSELDFQTARAIEKMARDIEYTLINGVYSAATDSSTANMTRGILNAAGTVIDGGGVDITKEALDLAMLEAWEKGAMFKDLCLFVNAKQKQALSKVYSSSNGFAVSSDRNVGGMNITAIETDFGLVHVVLDRFVPNDTIIGADVSVMAPVEMYVPDKGNFFREKRSDSGASETYMIYGEIGLDHGPDFMHFAIKNLA